MSEHRCRYGVEAALRDVARDFAARAEDTSHRVAADGGVEMVRHHRSV